MGEDSEGCGECKPDEVMHFARCHDDSLAALAAETFCTAMRSLGLLTRGLTHASSSKLHISFILAPSFILYATISYRMLFGLFLRGEKRGMTHWNVARRALYTCTRARRHSMHVFCLTINFCAPQRCAVSIARCGLTAKQPLLVGCNYYYYLCSRLVVPVDGTYNYYLNS